MKRYRFLLALLWEHAHFYLFGAFAVGLTLWMTLSIPSYLQEAIDILGRDPDPAGKAFLNRIGWILIFALAIMFTRTASRLSFYIPGRRVEFLLKNRLLTHLLTLQRSFYLKNPTGSIISRVNNDINGIRMMMGFGLMQMITSFSMLSMAPYQMYRISPTLTLYVAVPIISAFALLQLSLRRLRGFQLVQMKALQDLSDFTVESYNGIDVLKTYRAFSWVEGKFGRLSRQVRDAAVRMSTVRAFFMPILTHLVNGLKVMLVIVGGMMVIRAEMTMGQFMAYSLYLTMLVPPLMGLTFMMFLLQRGFTALTSLEEVFNTQAGLPPVDRKAEAGLREPVRQGLRVENLSFAYPDDPERPALSGVSLRVEPGEIVGVFGAIGSGKTTLVNLINRYLPPPAGTISLDGVDTTVIGLNRLRRSVVTVTQEPFLFSNSIRENISFAAEGKGKGVAAAAEAAALSDDLRRFPAGLDTMVGEKGITLSGGQKQRIALARSIMKTCDLLILDDVLSAVDHETERFLVERIYGFQHARSLLIVSHRISVLEKASRIVVLENGRVADTGTHAQLIAREGIYRTAHLLQTERTPAAGRPMAKGG